MFQFIFFDIFFAIECYFIAVLYNLQYTVNTGPQHCLLPPYITWPELLFILAACLSNTFPLYLLWEMLQIQLHGFSIRNNASEVNNNFIFYLSITL